MVTVGVRDLKNQLSQYLQFVKDGEKVIITEHNRIIAQITVPEQEDSTSSFEAKLVQMSKDGEVILAKRNKSIAKMPELNEKIDWESIYNEVRADRFS
ncbi:hypothetical protein FACS1894141_1320 [Spirochaetia bacterium]|nr:hypothetical protein FACS1894141_1320 [Spirochaetia bacterium]